MLNLDNTEALIIHWQTNRQNTFISSNCMAGRPSVRLKITAVARAIQKHCLARCDWHLINLNSRLLWATLFLSTLLVHCLALHGELIREVDLGNFCWRSCTIDWQALRSAFCSWIRLSIETASDQATDSIRHRSAVVERFLASKVQKTRDVKPPVVQYWTSVAIIKSMPPVP